MQVKKIKILIVDDAKIWAKHVMYKLEQLGIDYDWVKNGVYAVNKIREKIHYDAIIMDIMMPVMGGFEATQKIRKLGFKNPIIGHSSMYAKQDMSKSEQVGMNKYLSKGISLDPLIEILHDFKVIPSDPKEKD